MEKTPEEYLARMVEVFREVRRVLRPDGTLWLNMGDSYAGSWGDSGHRPDRTGIAGHQREKNTETFKRNGHPRANKPVTVAPPGLKPKDLCGIPWRLALALQADGWWLRRDIIWAKPNPMPESCQDRPTTAHEYIFLLTKSQKYFYDAEAVREKAIGQNHHDLTGCGYLAPGQTPQKGSRGHGFQGRQGGSDRVGPLSGGIGSAEWVPNPNGRNLRSVWTIATAPFPEAHFATFPPALPERCIKAGTSEKGVCPNCAAPWVRVVEKSGGTIGKDWNKHDRGENDLKIGATANNKTADGTYKVETTGWRPTCKCPHTEVDLLPTTILDPFSGAGTTALVAAKLGRGAIGLELNPEYVAMSMKRFQKELGMLVEVRCLRP